MTTPESRAGFERHAGRRSNRAIVSVSSRSSGHAADPSDGSQTGGGGSRPIEPANDPPGGGGSPPGGPAKSDGAAGARTTDKRRPDLNSSIAAAVREGYEVVEKNIAQARDAAQKFRQGELSAQHASQNTRQMLRRAIGLGRQTAAAWFDLAESLLETDRPRNPVPASDQVQAAWPPLPPENLPTFYKVPEPRHPTKMSQLEFKPISPTNAKVIEQTFKKTPTPLGLEHLTLKTPERPEAGAFLKDAAHVSFELGPSGETILAEVRFRTHARRGVYAAEVWQVAENLLFKIGLVRIEVGD